MLEVRKSIPNDWERLWPLLSSMGKSDNKKDTYNRFLHMVNDEHHFIAVGVKNEKMVGYGWIQDYGFHLRMGKKTTRLHDLYVLPEYRNEGVASELFLFLKDWASKNCTTWLQWNASPSAVDFYKKLGVEPEENEDEYPFFEIEFK
ncbi:GNAT family N-acetyltransferase [Ornithinibacillus sp. L9]|uniref:GNAT family N-acetyltransferase n=1 Tax=Ornithinibacillus caprae TaxID=2678566 RepID=A0A6N8FMP8_9BACI|nr:GNAT family N-acetyltransferase [Ornithinibacillus caprae]MUK90755.1 GNAT family N-acetyltransferase [Ornithinibacillus caprae]